MAQPRGDVEQDVEEDHGSHANPDPVLILGHTPAAEDGRLQSSRTGSQQRAGLKVEGSFCSTCSMDIDLPSKQ